MKFQLTLLSIIFFVFSLQAREPKHKEPVNNRNNNNTNQEATFRNDCQKPLAQVDMNINNVRARLTTGGDLWWDRRDGQYIVPKPQNEGDPEVSAIFAGSVWLGGIQDGNFRIAAQMYGNGGGNTRDFWAGPLDGDTGLTNSETCLNWDRFWEVTRVEIEKHIQNCNSEFNGGVTYQEEDIPLQIKGWPAQGNPYFNEINGFDLPVTSAGLGTFYDANGDGLYHPLEGDYPIAEFQSNCNGEIIPDQMFFWIYNDNGNIHTESNGDAIRIEVQVQSFAYAANNALNNTTFQRYKLINRAPARIDSTHFGLWLDVDLGCYTDDYIGCDPDRNLAYYYNVDDEDGDVGTNCPGGAPTYGTEIPVLGVDFLRTPNRAIFNSDGTAIIDYEPLAMSSFTYFNHDVWGGTSNPNTVQEYYNYLTGSWRDGSPFTYGGNGYGGTEPVKYAFPDPPNDQMGWSMCTAAEFNSPEYDRKTVQAVGPFPLLPGQINELVVGIIWVPDFDYPCPDLSRLFAADEQVNFFLNNACILQYPFESPEMDMIELDQEIVLTLSNKEFSNNANESFEQTDLFAPFSGLFPDLDVTYNFQGYQIFQLRDPEYIGDLNDPIHSRLVAQCDLEDGIIDITNWDVTGDFPEPNLMVEGENIGIRHTFVINEDAFAPEADNELINHKKYHYKAVAYAHNNWEDYDDELLEGQANPYKRSQLTHSYTAIPRPITNLNVNASSGESLKITRHDGVGVGGNFVEITEETKATIIANAFGKNENFKAPITYKEGQGPIEVLIYNPLEVQDGEYKIELLDEDYTENGDLTTWKLSSNNAETITYSDVTIEQLNEQLVADFGFSVLVHQVEEPGSQSSFSNGVIGVEEEYLNPNLDWYRGIENKGGELYDGVNLLFTDILSWGDDDSISVFDANKNLVEIGSGFLPFQLTNHVLPDNWQTAHGFISPNWVSTNTGNAIDPSSKLSELNNVDIIFTNNKDLWSECVVIETANLFYTTDLELPTVGGAANLEIRNSPSVTKEADSNGVPRVDSNPTRPRGIAWFPGYAIDVETGQRLNIFFGENSVYNCENFEDCSLFDNGNPTGADMMYNPDSQIFINTGESPDVLNFYLGGQHFIYVTNEAYDGCEKIHDELEGDYEQRIEALKKITWTGIGIMNDDFAMKSYEEGLIPNDLSLKIRVDNPYAKLEGTEEEQGQNPTYSFIIEGKGAMSLEGEEKESQLDKINVVPNPYYGYSDYESTETERLVKITNLPAKCSVTIYTLDGKFVRRFDRDEETGDPRGTGTLETQIYPDIEWDLQNSNGVGIGAGVYLIHVQSDELGERVLKWFGQNL